MIVIDAWLGLRRRTLCVRLREAPGLPSGEQGVRALSDEERGHLLDRLPREVRRELNQGRDVVIELTKYEAKRLGIGVAK